MSRLIDRVLLYINPKLLTLFSNIRIIYTESAIKTYIFLKNIDIKKVEEKDLNHTCKIILFCKKKEKKKRKVILDYFVNNWSECLVLSTVLKKTSVLCYTCNRHPPVYV